MGGGLQIIINIFFSWGGQREWLWGRIWPKNHKFALLSEYLAADLSPDASADLSAALSADASADALAIINIS